MKSFAKKWMLLLVIWLMPGEGVNCIKFAGADITIDLEHPQTIESNPGWEGTVFLNGGTLTAQTNDISLGNSIQVNDTNGTIHTVTKDKTLTLSGSLTAQSGNSILTKTGDGTLKITSTNAFAGTISVTDGVLEMASTRPNGSANNRIRQIQVSDAQMLLSSYNAFGTGQTFPELITLSNSKMHSTVSTSLNQQTNIGNILLNNSSVTSVPHVSSEANYVFGGKITATGNSSITAGTISFRNDEHSVDGKGTIDVTNAGDVLTISSALRVYSPGMMITKTGEGTLLFTGSTHSSEKTFKLNLQGGTFQMGNGGTSGLLTNALLSEITLSGGTFVYNRSEDHEYSNVILSGGTISSMGTGKLTIKAAAANGSLVTLAGSGAMDITLDTTTSALNMAIQGTGIKNIVKTGDQRGNFLSLQGDLSDFTGTMTVKGNNWVAFANEEALGSAKAHWILDCNLDAGLLVQSNDLAGKTVQLGNLTGNGIVRTNHAGTTTIQVGALLKEGEVSTFDGAISKFGAGNLALEKVGQGTWILTNAGSWSGTYAVHQNVHNYDGNTTIKEGTLQIGNGGTTGALPTASKVVIEADGTLAYNRSDNIQVSNAIQVNGGTIANLSTSDVIFTTALTGSGFTKTGEGKIIVTKHCFSDGKAEIVIKEGTLQAGGTSIDGNDSTGNSPPKVSGNLTIEKDGTFIVGRSGATTYSGKIAGEGTFIQQGNVAMYLSGNTSEFTGEWILQKGTTNISGDNRLGNGATVTFDGGTLATSMTENLNNDIHITDSGGRIHVNSTQISEGGAWNTKELYISGTLTGTGKWTVQANQRANFFHLDKLDTSDFAGTIETVGNSWVFLNGEKSNPFMTLMTNNTTDSGFLIRSSGDYVFGDIQGNGGWMRTDSALGDVSITVGGKGTTSDYHSTFSGSFRIFDNNLSTTRITVTKAGEGTWTLGSSVSGYRANEDNQASFVVNSGVLELARDAGKASAIDLTVNENGTLLLSTPGQRIMGTLASTGRILVDLKMLADILETPEISLLSIGSLDDSTDLAGSVDFLFDGSLTSGTAFDVNPEQIIGDTTWEFLPDSVVLYNALMEDISAYWLISANGDGSYHFTVDPAMVPEPSAVVLLLLGMLALGLSRYPCRRRG